jgi:hypothetical protein
MFFGLYVKDIVEKHFKAEGLKLSDTVIPEFPIAKAVISRLPYAKDNFPQLYERDDSTLQSVNVDYALFSKDGNVAYFVELKTDMTSRNKIQDAYLECCAKAPEMNISSLMEHIKKVAVKSNNSKSWKKYQNLLDLMGPQTREAKITVVYIQPEMPDDKHPMFDGAECIPFSEICGLLEKQKGEFPKLFAEYLCTWC